MVVQSVNLTTGPLIIIIGLFSTLMYTINHEKRSLDNLAGPQQIEAFQVRIEMCINGPA